MDQNHFQFPTSDVKEIKWNQLSRPTLEHVGDLLPVVLELEGGQEAEGTQMKGHDWGHTLLQDKK